MLRTVIDYFDQFRDWLASRKEAAYKWGLLCAKLELCQKILPETSIISNDDVKLISDEIGYLYKVSQKTLFPFDQDNFAATRLTHGLLRLKQQTHAAKNVPVEIRKAYGVGIAVLEIIDPDNANLVRSYRPRKAFMEIAKELDENPLSLAILASDILRNLDSAIFVGEGRTNYLQTKDGSIITEGMWDVYLKAGRLIPKKSITFHIQAAQWMGSNCFDRDSKETDEELCNRVVKEFRRVYGISSPCEVRIEKSEADKPSAICKDYEKPLRHEITFTNLHKLDAVQKFAWIMHECTHMYQNEIAFNPEYIQPEKPYIGDGFKGIDINLSPVTTTNGIVTDRSGGNAHKAIAALGKEKGIKHYRLDANKREALLVEQLAQLGMFQTILSQQDQPIEAETIQKFLLVQLLEILDRVMPDIDPTTIVGNFDYGLRLTALSPPEPKAPSRRTADSAPVAYP